MSFSRYLIGAEYPVTKISNFYCFDVVTAGKMAKELLDYKQVSNLVVLQAVVISNQSNVIDWQAVQLSNVEVDKKQARRQAFIGRMKTGFSSGILGTVVGFGGAMVVILIILL